MDSGTREDTKSAVASETETTRSPEIKGETQSNNNLNNVSEPELLDEEIEEEEEGKVNGGVHADDDDVDDDDDDDLEEDFEEMENSTKSQIVGKKKKDKKNNQPTATAQIEEPVANNDSEASENSATEFQCKWEDCNLNFPELHELVTHLNSTHVAQKRDKSSPCTLGNPTVIQSNANGASVNLKPDNAQYICKWENCPRNGFPQHSRFALIAHIRTHTGEKPFYCLVPECLKSFPRSDSLLKHLKTVHEIESSNLNDALEIINSKLENNKITTDHLENFKFLDNHQPEFEDESLWVDKYKALLKNYSTDNLLKLFEIKGNNINPNLKRSIIEEANKSQSAFKRQKNKISVDDIYNDEITENEESDSTDPAKTGSANDPIESQLTSEILKKNVVELEKYYEKLVSLGRVIDVEVEKQLEQRRHAWMKTQLLLDSILKEHNLL